MEYVIGFDVRKKTKKYNWDFERRSLYLIKKNIIKPLSVDIHVWNRVLFPENPNYFGLWEDELTLIKAVSQNSLEKFQLIGISISIIIENKKELNILKEKSQPVFSITKTKKDWELIGYDIADEALTSGLMNCGYSKDFKKYLWESELNKFHLFENLEDAAAFKKNADNRIPEHFPFFVFGIYNIPKLSGI